MVGWIDFCWRLCNVVQRQLKDENMIKKKNVATSPHNCALSCWVSRVFSQKMLWVNELRDKNMFSHLYCDGFSRSRILYKTRMVHFTSGWQMITSWNCHQTIEKMMTTKFQGTQFSDRGSCLKHQKGYSSNSLFRCFLKTGLFQLPPWA